MILIETRKALMSALRPTDSYLYHLQGVLLPLRLVSPIFLDELVISQHIYDTDGETLIDVWFEIIASTKVRLGHGTFRKSDRYFRTVEFAHHYSIDIEAIPKEKKDLPLYLGHTRKGPGFEEILKGKREISIAHRLHIQKKPKESLIGVAYHELKDIKHAQKRIIQPHLP